MTAHLGAKILYVCSGRGFFSAKPGRKIGGVVECWREMGFDVMHVSGGDILRNVGHAAGIVDYGATSFHRRWYRRWRILAPLLRSISEWRDIRHDKDMERSLKRVCEVHKPDLIWERSSRLHSAGLKVARSLGVPFVLEWKDHLVDYQYSLFRRGALVIESEKTTAADHIVVESGVLREMLSRGGVDHDKIIVAHNAVDTEEFSRDDKKRVRVRGEFGLNDGDILVGYLGSFAFYHDTARLVLAAEIIRAALPSENIKILMVGAGKECADTTDLANRLGLLGNMLIMKPGVAKNEVPGILSALDIAVLPGSTDIICPIKVQEYMACELPTVVPDYVCNREVIRDGESGALFAPGSEASLAEVILGLASNKALRDRMGRCARGEVVRRFSWRATWGSAVETVLNRDRASYGSAEMTAKLGSD